MHLTSLDDAMFQNPLGTHDDDEKYKDESRDEKLFVKYWGHWDPNEKTGPKSRNWESEVKRVRRRIASPSDPARGYVIRDPDYLQSPDKVMYFNEIYKNETDLNKHPAELRSFTDNRVF